MHQTVETRKRKLALVPLSRSDVEAWRRLLGLDRGGTGGVAWGVNQEARYRTTPRRSLRPETGAPTEIWDMLKLVHGDSVAVADARRRAAEAQHRAAVDEFVDWLDAEDFGTDPLRMRREAWR